MSLLLVEVRQSSIDPYTLLPSSFKMNLLYNGNVKEKCQKKEENIKNIKKY